MIGNFWNLTVLSEKSEIPLNNLQNYYFIGTSPNKTPLSFTDINKVIALVYLLPDLLVQLPAGDLNISVFQKQAFDEAVNTYLNKHPDYIILSQDLTQSLSNDQDLLKLITHICNENSDLVLQYKQGNTKVLNALFGKIIKTDKTLEPKTTRELLEKYLQND